MTFSCVNLTSSYQWPLFDLALVDLDYVCLFTGSVVTFRIYAVACIIVLALYLGVNFLLQVCTLIYHVVYTWCVYLMCISWCVFSSVYTWLRKSRLRKIGAYNTILRFIRKRAPLVGHCWRVTGIILSETSWKLLVRRCHIWVYSGSNQPQMGQIWNLFRSYFRYLIWKVLNLSYLRLDFVSRSRLNNDDIQCVCNKYVRRFGKRDLKSLCLLLSYSPFSLTFMCNLHKKYQYLRN